MNRLFSSFTICAALFTSGASASASQLVPSIFASAFCTAMDYGVKRQEAIRFAVKMSLDTTRPRAAKVGNTDLDVRASVYAAETMCPQHFNWN